jgi:chromosome partitioning protein
MFIISCLNLKGGCGKSTICLNLAACLSGHKYKVLVIDLDPQRSITRWSKQAKTLESSLSTEVYPLKLDSKRPALQFRTDIETLIAETGSNLILLDTPPQLEDAALLAALISDLILIPVTPSPLDLWAAEAAVKTGREARRERKKKKPRITLLPSKVQPQTVLGRELKETLSALGEPVGPIITQRVALVESAVVGQTINQYAPNSPSHIEFKKLAAYVLEIMKGIEDAQKS